jgi:hypothetical protein
MTNDNTPTTRDQDLFALGYHTALRDAAEIRTNILAHETYASTAEARLAHRLGQIDMAGAILKLQPPRSF